MVTDGKLRAAGGRFGLAQTWMMACLLLANACAANLSRDTANLGCEVGTEGCACYGNWSCNYQLSCIDDMCLDRRKLAAENAQLLTQSSLRSTDPIVAAASESCMGCLEDACVSPLATCYDRAGCATLAGCLLSCAHSTGETYGDCVEICYANAPIDAHERGTRVQRCAQTQCSDVCREQRQPQPTLD